jgi:hypothetical protein
MTNRREFLHLSVAALSLPIAARAGVTPGPIPSGERADAEPFYKVFFDERFPASAAFAAEARRLSIPVHAIRGDITNVWFDDLYYRWKQGPAAIAGLTAPGPIFCLEMLARDAGLRVAFRADHRRLAGGHVEHQISAPENVLAQATDLAGNTERWPEQMAELMAQFPTQRGPAAKTSITSPAERHGNNPDHLVTWIIAPAPRA